MTLPRLLLPKQTYLVTRRCAQRAFLLKPNRKVKKIFHYCLAYASKLFGVEVHAYIVMSNHYHLLITETDNEVRLPQFMHWLNLHIAKAMNQVLNREENFWSSRPYSAVLLAGKDAVFDKFLYVTLNAVKENLASQPNQWPGAKSEIQSIGTREYQHHRPGIFFRPQSPLPEKVCLKLTIPPPFKDMSPTEFQSLVKRGIKERHQQSDTLPLKLPRRNDTESGQTHLKKPIKIEPKIRFNPRFACKNVRFRRALHEAWRDFVNAYKCAWTLWKSGVRELCFPKGTYLMRLKHRVPCSITNTTLDESPLLHLVTAN